MGKEESKYGRHNTPQEKLDVLDLIIHTLLEHEGDLGRLIEQLEILTGRLTELTEVIANAANHDKPNGVQLPKTATRAQKNKA